MSEKLTNIKYNEIFEGDKINDFIDGILETAMNIKDDRDGLAAEVDRLEEASDRDVVSRNYWYQRYVEHSDSSNDLHDKLDDLQDEYDEERENHGDTLNLMDELQESKEYWYQAYIDEAEEGLQAYRELQTAEDEYQDQLLACEQALASSMETTDFILTTALEAIDHMEAKQDEQYNELSATRSENKSLMSKVRHLNHEYEDMDEELASLQQQLRNSRQLETKLRHQIKVLSSGCCCDEDDDYEEYVDDLLIQIIRGL